MKCVVDRKGRGVVIGMAAFVRNGEDDFGNEAGEKFGERMRELGEVERGFLVGDVEMDCFETAGEGERGAEFSATGGGVIFTSREAICVGVAEIAR